MQAVPNFSGLKFTDSNFYFFQRLVQLGGDRLNLISGPDEICLGGMVAGSDAAIGTTYNVMPKLFVEMRQHFEASDIQPAMALQARANEVISTLFHFDLLAAVKEILTMRGLPVGPAPPAPHPVRRCGPRRAMPGARRPRLRSGMRAIPLPDGDLRYAPDFLAPAEADQFMRQLLTILSGNSTMSSSLVASIPRRVFPRGTGPQKLTTPIRGWPSNLNRGPRRC